MDADRKDTVKGEIRGIEEDGHHNVSILEWRLAVGWSDIGERPLPNPPWDEVVGFEEMKETVEDQPFH
jgi:hypothetical protein